MKITTNFILIIVLSLISLQSCKKDRDLGTGQLIVNPAVTSADCEDETDFPAAPNWAHQEFLVLDDVNNGWVPHFINSKVGLIYGRAGKVYRTVDGGKSWAVVFNNKMVLFNGIFFLDSQHGFLAGFDGTVEGPEGYGGAIYETTNGGASWTRKFELPDKIPGPIFFKDEMNAIATIHEAFFNSSQSSNRYVAKTSDGGKTWERIPDIPEYKVGSSYRILNIQPNGFAYTVTLDGVVYTSNNFGENWRKIETEFEFIFDMQFIDEMNGYVHADQMLFKTIDGGVNWTIISELPLDFLHFFTVDDGISMQSAGVTSHGDYWDECKAFFTTQDGGKTWLQGESSFNLSIGEFPFFLNDKLGFITKNGNPGTIVRLERG